MGFLSVLVLGAIAMVGGCSQAPSGETGPCPRAPVIAPMAESPDERRLFEETAVLVNDYGQKLVGFDVVAAQVCAEAAGLAWRVVAEDGEYFAVTEDFRPERLNAVVEDSVVIEITAG